MRRSAVELGVQRLHTFVICSEELFLELSARNARFLRLNRGIRSSRRDLTLTNALRTSDVALAPAVPGSSPVAGLGETALLSATSPPFPHGKLAGVRDVPPFPACTCARGWEYACPRRSRSPQDVGPMVLESSVERRAQGACKCSHDPMCGRTGGSVRPLVMRSSYERTDKPPIAQRKLTRLRHTPNTQLPYRELTPAPGLCLHGDGVSPRVGSSVFTTTQRTLSDGRLKYKQHTCPRSGQKR